MKKHAYKVSLVLTLVAVMTLWAAPVKTQADNSTGEWNGTVNAIPNGGAAGIWVIGGQSFQADSNTQFESENGALAMGVCASVAWFTLDGTHDIALSIKTKPAADCAAGSGNENENTSDEAGQSTDANENDNSVVAPAPAAVAPAPMAQGAAPSQSSSVAAAPTPVVVQGAAPGQSSSVAVAPTPAPQGVAPSQSGGPSVTLNSVGQAVGAILNGVLNWLHSLVTRLVGP